MTVRFNLHQLELFVAVAEELHFTKAAERMHISQPPLTRQIRTLEGSLGFELFVRSSRKVELTRAGQAFYVEARRVLEAAERAAAVAMQAARADVGTVVIGAVESAVVDLLPVVLAEFARRFPFTQVQVRVLHTREQEHGLAERELLFGILRPPTQSSDLKLQLIYGDRLVAAVPEDFPWDPDRGFEQLADSKFISYAHAMGEGVQSAALQICIAHGFVPLIEQEVSSTAMLMGLIGEGKGVTLLPKPYTLTQQNGVSFYGISRPDQVSGVAMAWRAGQEDDPLVLALREITAHAALELYGPMDVQTVHTA